jgi:transcriptional regulator with XRE-family HTH domain
LGFLKGNFMNPLRTRFGKRLRKIRRDRDITQEQLAEAVNVTGEFISNLERGKSAPSFETVEKLAEALGVDVEEFFKRPT